MERDCEYFRQKFLESIEPFNLKKRVERLEERNKNQADIIIQDNKFFKQYEEEIKLLKEELDYYKSGLWIKKYFEIKEENEQLRFEILSMKPLYSRRLLQRKVERYEQFLAGIALTEDEMGNHLRAREALEEGKTN